MSIPINQKRTVAPIHPGEMLREDFMPDYGLTVTALAAAPGRISANGKRTAAMPPCRQSGHGIASFAIVR